MGLDVAPIEPAGFNSAPDRAPRDARARAAADDVDATTLSGDIPAGPPPEVLEAMDAAGRTARELHAQGRELHFIPGDHGERVRIEVKDLDGNVLREIPPSQALDVATGHPLD
ncbi:MAG TPA: hypothetical protein VFV85_00125 [Conexibacter sp.]|nr:hypothetical protein [Conexibacter sp.]